MSESAIKSYEKTLELCKVIIEEHFKPCGLDQDVKKQLFDLILEWERKCRQPFTYENGAFNCVYRITREAMSLTERFHKGEPKQECDYLSDKLEKGELRHWFWKFHKCQS